jgi:hypothetical protein
MEKFENPTIVQETIRPSERVEVQPVVHIDKDQVEVHKVTQPMRERDIAPTRVEHNQLPPQHLEFAAPQTQFRSTQPTMASRTLVEPIQRTTCEMSPIVDETIHRKVIEEVQPVLYKETLAPTVIHTTRPIHEHIVEPTQYMEETREFVDLGTRNLETIPRGLEQGFPAQQYPLQQGFPAQSVQQGLPPQPNVPLQKGFPPFPTAQTQGPKEIVEEKITVTQTQYNPPKTVI